MGKGLEAGFSGDVAGRPGRDIVSALGKLNLSGTLYLEGKGSGLILIAEGKVCGEFGFSFPVSLKEACRRYYFQPHEDVSRPRLPSCSSNSPVAALRALPGMGLDTRLRAGFTDFRTLLLSFKRSGFSGVLKVHTEAEEGLALFYRGSLQAAAYGSENRVQTGDRALRSMYRQCSQEAGSPEAGSPETGPPEALCTELAFHRLEPTLVAALSGLALGKTLSPGSTADGLKTFTGVEVAKKGYLFYLAGRNYLFVEAQTIGPPRLYQAVADADDLALPSKPTGWEKRRYRLTLRGVDALNPMTDLYLNVGSRLGPLLKLLERAVPVEQLAAGLEVDDEELRMLLEGLEEEGLIRAV